MKPFLRSEIQSGMGDFLPSLSGTEESLTKAFHRSRCVLGFTSVPGIGCTWVELHRGGEQGWEGGGYRGGRKPKKAQRDLILEGNGWNFESVVGIGI